jgi:hypothetical protein
MIEIYRLHLHMRKVLPTFIILWNHLANSGSYIVLLLKNNQENSPVRKNPLFHYDDRNIQVKLSYEDYNMMGMYFIPQFCKLNCFMVRCQIRDKVRKVGSSKIWFRGRLDPFLDSECNEFYLCVL